jgi:undecaprenyl-diphosphatase
MLMIGRWLGPATAGLVLSGISFGLFAVIAWNVLHETALTRCDAQVVAYLHEQQEPALYRFFAVVTEIGSFPLPLLPFFVVAGVLAVRRRHLLLFTICLLAMVLGQRLNHALKDLFQRPRPPFSGWNANDSFPSGHTMGAVIRFGILAYLFVVLLPVPWVRWAVSLLALPVLLVAFSRLYLEVHYFSDVIGGLAAGLGWLAAWIAVSEGLRRSRGPTAE